MTHVPFSSLFGFFRGLYNIFLRSFSVHPKFVQPPVVATTVAKPKFMSFKPQAILQAQAEQIPRNQSTSTSQGPDQSKKEKLKYLPKQLP